MGVRLFYRAFPEAGLVGAAGLPLSSWEAFSHWAMPRTTNLIDRIEKSSLTPPSGSENKS